MSDKVKNSMWSKLVGDKRRWWAYKERIRNLPPNYREAVLAIERYVMRFGPTDVEGASSLLEDIADIFERAAADDTPIRQIVGDDPVEFVDALISNYTSSGWVAKEQQRLIDAIHHAAGDSS